MSITYKLPVKVDGQVAILEYSYAEEEVLKHVQPRAHAFWKEAVQQMADAFPAFALLAGEADWGRTQRGQPHLIFTQQGVVEAATGNPHGLTREYFYPTWKGNLPLKVEDTPFLAKLKQRLKRAPKRKAEYLKYFGKHEGKTVMLIPVNIGYSARRSRHSSDEQIDPVTQQPWTYLPNDYFSILDIPIDHTYGSVHQMGVERLCQYLNHRTNIKAHDALKQRVIPRFVLDLCLANIKALGMWRTFEEWMRDNHTNLHAFYNVVGRKSKRNEDFLHFYRSAMRSG